MEVAPHHGQGAELRRGLEAEQLLPYYQAKIDLETSRRDRRRGAAALAPADNFGDWLAQARWRAPAN